MTLRKLLDKGPVQEVRRDGDRFPADRRFRAMWNRIAFQYAKMEAKRYRWKGNRSFNAVVEDIALSMEDYFGDAIWFAVTGEILGESRGFPLF